LKRSCLKNRRSIRLLPKRWSNKPDRFLKRCRETHPDDKDEIADTLRQGLEAYRGAMAEIAEQYGAAMKNAAELNQLVEQMRKKIDQWASQTIEAKRGSMIENVEMWIKASGGKQEVRAEDDSSISGVKQIIE
jgi:hypothetical protein